MVQENDKNEKSDVTSFRASKAVVDTSALIKAPLDEICKFSETLYTIDDVLAELRDKKTKHKLTFVPNYLKVMQPHDDSLNFVREFSKKAGCYQVLSLVDLKIIALTYQLYVEEHGAETLNPEPKHLVKVTQRKQVVSNPDQLLVNNADLKIPGFFMPEKEKVVDEMPKKELEKSKSDDTSSENQKSKDKNYDNDHELGLKIISLENESTREDNGNDEKLTDNDLEEEQETPKVEIEESIHSDFNEANGCKTEEFNPYEGFEEADYNGAIDESESDDDSGWITQDNLREAQQKMERINFEDLEEGSDNVVCVTLDYAMQQVLQLIGLTVMSVDGVKMARMKSFVLRCYACNSKTPDLKKVFCSNCGLKTLKRLFYSIDSDGSIVYHYSKNYVHNTRGFRYHIPKPQGGKHGRNPWIAEDQRFPKNQAPKKNRIKTMPLDPDYMANSSPFVTRDTHSRFFNTCFGSQHHFKWMQKNPNENKGGSGNRKKKNRP